MLTDAVPVRTLKSQREFRAGLISIRGFWLGTSESPFPSAPERGIQFRRWNRLGVDDLVVDGGHALARKRLLARRHPVKNDP